MHAIDFLKNPSKLPLRPIYALYGDEPFLRREVFAQIRELALPGEDAEASVSRFMGESARLAAIFDELRTLPFFAKRRLVAIEGADPFVTMHRKELEAYAEHPAASGILVLSVKLWPATTKLAKAIEKVGLAIECKGPSERALAPWLIDLAAKRCDFTLDPDAASLLVELVGPEVGLLVAELEKLAVYVGVQKHVRRTDVAKLVDAGRIETVWKMIEAATTGRPGLALDHLDGLLAAGENPVGILAQLSAALRKVHNAGRYRRLKLDLADACAKAGIYPGAVETTRRQHAHLGPSRVDRLPRLLLKADLDLKGSSQLVPRVILEQLLVSLASPRLD